MESRLRLAPTGIKSNLGDWWLSVWTVLTTDSLAYGCHHNQKLRCERRRWIADECRYGLHAEHSLNIHMLTLYTSLCHKIITNSLCRATFNNKVFCVFFFFFWRIFLFCSPCITLHSWSCIYIYSIFCTTNPYIITLLQVQLRPYFHQRATSYHSLYFRSTWGGLRNSTACHILSSETPCTCCC